MKWLMGVVAVASLAALATAGNGEDRWLHDRSRGQNETTLKASSGKSSSSSVEVWANARSFKENRSAPDRPKVVKSSAANLFGVTLCDSDAHIDALSLSGRKSSESLLSQFEQQLPTDADRTTDPARARLRFPLVPQGSEAEVTNKSLDKIKELVGSSGIWEVLADLR